MIPALPDSIVYLAICTITLLAGEWWHQRCRRRAAEAARLERIRRWRAACHLADAKELGRRITEKRAELYAQLAEAIKHRRLAIDWARPGGDRHVYAFQHGGHAFVAPPFRAFQPHGATN